tara:strand:+ start:3610 stop:3753 length:144 start_codon:yes stop_codon:yes gene_type:complete
MKLKKKLKLETVFLRKKGSTLPNHKLDLTLKRMGLPPYKTKEKVIVP